MVRIGYFLSSEEFGPIELTRQAGLAEQHGFDALWISDHFHPWNDEQGNSPFVWSVIGALSEVTRLSIATAVTCPTVRIHPAVIAQAAATAAIQCRGGFTLGVGSGEALNEHILGDVWPAIDQRLDKLAEAVDLIRTLHRGKAVNHRGEHYTVDNARIYTLPPRPVPIYVSAFGPKAARLAGRIGDGFVCTKPDGDLLRIFRESGGTGPSQAGFKVCYAPDKDDAVRTAHRLWPNTLVPGELSQVLPAPAHFQQASQLVTPEMIADTIPCGPDPQPYADLVHTYLDAGYDELYVQQIGPLQDRFFDFWTDQVRPLLPELATTDAG
jgi:G6PDH family F420-dependent oxidoreductase